MSHRAKFHKNPRFSVANCFHDLENVSVKISDHKGRKKLTEYDRGDDFDQKAIYQRITKRLKNLVTRYDSSMPISEKIKFVKNVAHLINTD